MKVTSEQLLDLFGLKVGDKLRIEDIDFIVKKFINDDQLYLDNKGYCSSLMRLIDKDYEIIKQTPKLSEDEKVMLRILPKEYKQIARDKYGNLVCGNNLERDKIGWHTDESEKWNYLIVFNDLFKFITWEDEEPYNIKELLDE